jgi:4-phytase/acid phosphatase
LGAVIASLLLAAFPTSADSPAKPELQYVVIVTRHGVRAPTWELERLNQYSAEPWPVWDAAPGELTRHGRQLIGIMGGYYGQWLGSEKLLKTTGCADVGRVYIYADKDQRTLETGGALSEALLPGCKIEVHHGPDAKSDPLFSGFGAPDPERAAADVRERLGTDPQKLAADHRAALDELQSIVKGPVESAAISVNSKGKAPELTGPFTTGSTFSENLLLEYANGMEGSALGWGRLTREKLERILEVHTTYADLMRRTPFLARARGSNLLSHIVSSMEQAVAGKAVDGAIGDPGSRVLALAGHDTNLSNLSGMLGLSWKLAGYQPDDTPPGGALIFTLWRTTSTGEWSFGMRYLAQSLDQMRFATPLSLDTPPESQEVALPGCGTPCTWEKARRVLEGAIDPGFVRP